MSGPIAFTQGTPSGYNAQRPAALQVPNIIDSLRCGLDCCRPPPIGEGISSSAIRRYRFLFAAVFIPPFGHVMASGSHCAGPPRGVHSLMIVIFAGPAKSNQIIEDAIGHGLIKNAVVAEALQIEFVTFEFKAQLIRHVAQARIVP